MILDLTATSVFVALFLLVTWIGFVAARWRKADLNLYAYVQRRIFSAVSNNSCVSRIVTAAV